MNYLSFFSVALMLALPAAGLGADTPAKPITAPLPPGHPPMPALQQPPSITGKVLETMDSGGYTYVRLQQEKGEKIWVAFPKAKVAVGKKLSLVAGEEFKNFESKTLNRTFDRIIFSLGPVPKKGAKGAPHTMPAPGSKGARVAPEKISVQKPQKVNAHTVAELFAQKDKLNGKKVIVRGKVVKVSKNIMKRNWIHLQDGTGSAEKNNHDLVATTQILPEEGQVITVMGTLLKDKDFGMGYKYEVIIDNTVIAPSK